MTPTSRATPSTVIAGLVIAICLVAITWFFWPIRGIVFQLYALIAIFFALRSAPPVARWLGGLPPVHRAIFYLLLAAVAAGQFSLSTRKFYPFVAWDIFSSVSNQETVFCRELIGTTADGHQVRLLAEQLFPSIIQFDLPPDRDSVTLERLVAALAKQYNSRHAADPVREVDLMLVAVKLHPPPGETRQPSCELLQRFELSPEHSS